MNMAMISRALASAAALAGVAALPEAKHRELGEGCRFCGPPYSDSCDACTKAGGIWQSKLYECGGRCNSWGGACISATRDCHPGSGQGDDSVLRP
jgi:hypothetical protein